ncbi:MAG: MATE family efflux transporter, partial [Cellulosilyticaceae bacterium]
IQINIRFVACVSVIGCILSICFTEALVGVFTSPSNPVYHLAVTGNRICSIGLLFLGLNTLTSGMFTALSNGWVSAVLAFTRTFVLTVLCILLLPALLGGVTGVWLATPVAEILGLMLSITYFLKYKKKYHY